MGSFDSDLNSSAFRYSTGEGNALGICIQTSEHKRFCCWDHCAFIAIALVIIFGVDEYSFLFLSTHAWLGLGMILLGLLGGVEIGRCIEVYSRRAYNAPRTD